MDTNLRFRSRGVTELDISELNRSLHFIEDLTILRIAIYRRFPVNNPEYVRSSTNGSGYRVDERQCTSNTEGPSHDTEENLKIASRYYVMYEKPPLQAVWEYQLAISRDCVYLITK